MTEMSSAHTVPWPEGFGGFTWLVSDGFAGGAILALIAREPSLTKRKFVWISVSALFACAVLLSFGAPFGILSRRNLTGAALQLAAAHFLFFGVVGIALCVGSSRWKSLVNFRVLSFYGEISYGLYLIHWLIFPGYDAMALRFRASLANYPGNFGLLTLRFLCAAGTSTLIAWLSRKFYEERFLRLKSRFS